jgi:hypothetical protein
METVARGWQIVSPAPYRTSTYCGSPASGAGYVTFPDVCGGNCDNGLYAYVETVAAHGAIGGYPDGLFRPATNISRAQMSKIIDAALNNDGYPTCEEMQQALYSCQLADLLSPVVSLLPLALGVLARR